MTSEQQEACMTLQSNSCGLEETFLSVGRDFIINDDDLEYAIEACESILEAIKTIKYKG